MNPPIRVLIVDDDALVRAGLSMMLSGSGDIEVVGEVGDGAAVAGAVNSHRPDVVLMDIRMPIMDGLTATEALRARREPPQIIVMTTFDTDEYVLRALRAGASGFLLKHTPPPEIIRAIQLVAAGEPMLSPTVMRRLMTRVASGFDPRRDSAREKLNSLSDGELAIAKLVGTGKANNEIAKELSVSLATVKTYVSRLLTKLDLNNRVQIALLVHNAGYGDTDSPNRR